MSPRQAKPKKLTVAAQAAEALARIQNALETEHCQPTRADVQSLVDATTRLLERNKALETLVDNYALNRSNASRLELASRNLIADAATRHGSLYRSLKRR